MFLKRRGFYNSNYGGDKNETEIVSSFDDNLFVIASVAIGTAAGITKLNRQKKHCFSDAN